MTHRSFGRPSKRTLFRLSLVVAAAAAGIVLGVVPAGAAPGGGTGTTSTPPPGASTSTTPTCPSDNPPNTLLLAGGTPQSAQLGAAFQAPLQVMLANTNDCPVTSAVAGTPVTFTAPSSGATARFASSGSNIAVVGADAQGNVTAPQLTADTVAGGYTVVASSAYGSVDFELVNTVNGLAATIEPLSPPRQSAEVGAQYGAPLQVKVLDANGNPLDNATVTFALGSDPTSAGGTFDGGSAQVTELTDATGVATSPRFTANEVAGRFTATASTMGITEPVAFALDNVAGKPSTISVVGTARRSARVDERYASVLEVRVRDGHGAPLAGQTITFTLGSAGGAGGTAAAAGATFTGGAAQATATTNAAGIAKSPRLVANGTAGGFSAVASLTPGTAQTTFSLRNRAGRPATVTAGAAASESTAVQSRFPIRLAVTVTDAESNPVAGARVRFTAPAHGPRGTFVRGRRRLRTVVVRTNAAGLAVAPAFVAGGRSGGYVVKASVRGAPPAGFALVNEA